MRRGLARDDVFTVGIDVTMTESMAHCDVVLPAATHFEYADLYPSYGHHWLQRAEAVIPPLGESLPNTEIFRRLAARFGFDEPCFKATDEELMDDAVDPADPRLGGVRPSRISHASALQMKGPDGKPMVLFENVFPATPSGRIELKSEALAKRWGAAALHAGLARAAGDLSADADFACVRQANFLDAGRPGGLAQGAAAADEPDAMPRSGRLAHGVDVRVWNELRRGDPAARRHRRCAARRGCQREGGVACRPAAPGRRFRRWSPPTCAPTWRKAPASTTRWWRWRWCERGQADGQSAAKPIDLYAGPAAIAAAR